MYSEISSRLSREQGDLIPYVEEFIQISLTQSMDAVWKNSFQLVLIMKNIKKRVKNTMKQRGKMYEELTITLTKYVVLT